MQPWVTRIFSGETRNALSKALSAADSAGVTSPDFSVAVSDFDGVFNPRQRSKCSLLLGYRRAARYLRPTT
jgi:hypothetical protein